VLLHGVTFNEIVVSIEIVPLIYNVTRLKPPPATPHKLKDKNSKATPGLVPIGYRGALLSSLLQVTVYVTHNLLNVLVQIANKMKLKKINVKGMGCSCLETTKKVEPEVIQFIWIVII
jgi:hypothetical protein